MNARLTWMLKTLIMGAAILLLNYPITFAICHDITPHFTTLVTTVVIISLLYAFIVLCGPHHFHALLIGLLAGNLIALLTWLVSFREIIFNMLDPDKLSVYYSLGIFIPIVIHLFIGLKQDQSPTKKIHITTTAIATFGLFAYLMFDLFSKGLHDPKNYNYFHFTLGIAVGLITTSVIHFMVSRNILVFEKLSFYIQAMAKPVIAFFLGYLLIMFMFAGIYTLTYFSDSTTFTHLKNDTFGELMFYSFSTITGMTFSAVEPQHPFTFFLTTLEHFLGLVWMTVVFAAALAHLQVPFRKISLQLEKLMSEDKNRPAL